MAKQTINIGTVANDGTGSNLRVGGTIINDNFNEIYTAIGDGSNITFTSSSSIALTNKTISASSNTITGLTNTNLSGTAGITNANLANPFIQFSDESSTVNSTALGGKLEFLAGEGINTTVGASSLTISAELASSSNAGVATFNTASFTVTSGDVTIKSAGVSNAQLANSTITLGSTSTSLGDTTTSVAGLSLTGSTNTIDLTSSGNKLRFNFANTGAFPNATTYQGLFAVATGTAKAYFADSGAYNEILSENSSIKDLSDVAGTNPTNGQILIFNSTSGLYEPSTPAGTGTVTSITAGTGLSGGTITTSGTISITNPNIKFADSSSTVSTINLGNTLSILGGNGITTSLNGDELTITRTSLSYSTGNFTGDGSTINFTINSGRAVDNVFVIVNGLILVPTTDYTISGTTLSFVEAPTASAEIQVRYLPL